MNLSEQMYVDLKAQLPSLVEAIKVGAEYGGDLAHRFILFDIWSNILQIFFLLSLTIGAGIIAYKSYYKSQWEDGGPNNFAAGVFMLFSLLFGAFSFASLFVVPELVGSILKGIFIPEIRIVELLSSLIK